jgi:predicted DNA binding CopG/RHH family protein
MRKIKLTRTEKSIEESLEQFVPVDKNEYEQIVQAIASRRKDAVLNIRVNRNDLKSIKHKAHKLGIKYQTFISEILHRVAEA